MEQKEIKLYALSTCGHCRSTKKFLDKCKVKYDCVEVDKATGEERNQLIDEVRKLNPACSFPTLKIGDKVIVGYRENQIKEALEQ